MLFFIFYLVLGDKDRDYIISYDDFYFLFVVCDHWLYVIMGLYIIIDLGFSFFIFYVLFWGVWVYNPCDMGIIELFIS